MQSFDYEHRFGLPPQALARLMDDSGYRDFLNARLPGTLRTEQEIIGNSSRRREKVLRTAPRFDVPPWLEKLLVRYSPVVEQKLVLDKKTLRERVFWQTGYGRFDAEVFYLPGEQGGTVRRFTGCFECILPVIGRAAEKVISRQLRSLYDQEAAVTQAYIVELSGAGVRAPALNG